MAPPALPDPGLHTTYIVQPHDFISRYSQALASTDRLREGARVGFLIPARISYLVFGAVPGFFVTRYVFALIAVVPAYVLLRRLYGRAAGALGVITIMSCPVVITAWGTDYPDSAVVSYLIGALACFAMPSQGRARRAWLAAGSALATMAVWSHQAAVPLVAATVAVYALLRLKRDRFRFGGDCIVLVLVALIVTASLIVASGVLLGRYNFIGLTWESLKYLSGKDQTAIWHSSNWHWLLYVPYLLLPLAIFGAWFATFGTRLRVVSTPAIFVIMACTTQIMAFAYLQFFAGAWTLESHYFSSQLWAVVCLTLVIVLCEIARPIFEYKFARWFPALSIVAMVRIYETDPHVPAFGWLPTGVFVAVLLVVIAFVASPHGIGRLHTANRLITVLAVVFGVVGVSGCALVLTVAVRPSHPVLAGVASKSDPAPNYRLALGGRNGYLIDAYRVASELPGFVDSAPDPGEQLLMWWPHSEFRKLNDSVSMYYAGFNSLPSGPPILTIADQVILGQRRPALLLLLSYTGSEFPAAISSLAPYHPNVQRETVLRSRTVVVHAWLVTLGRYERK